MADGVRRVSMEAGPGGFAVPAPSWGSNAPGGGTIRRPSVTVVSQQRPSLTQTMMSPRLSQQRPSLTYAAQSPRQSQCGGAVATAWGTPYPASASQNTGGHRIVADTVTLPSNIDAEHSKVVNLDQAGGAGAQFSSPFGFSQGEPPQSQLAPPGAGFPPGSAGVQTSMQYGAASSMCAGRGSTFGAVPMSGRRSVEFMAVVQCNAQDVNQGMNMAMGQLNEMMSGFQSQQGMGGPPGQGQWSSQPQQPQWNPGPQQWSHAPQQQWGQQQWQQQTVMPVSSGPPPNFSQQPRNFGAGPPGPGPPPGPTGPQPILSGWLSKRGEDFKQTYDTKWFALQPGAIVTMAGTENGPEERRVQLHPATEARPFDHPMASGEAKVQRMKRKWGFELFEGYQTKAWMIDPGTEQKRNIWVQAINQEIARLRQGGGQCGPQGGPPSGFGQGPCQGGFGQGAPVGWGR